MRILYLSPWFPYPLDLGFRIRVYHLLKALTGSHRVSILGLQPRGCAQPQMDGVRPFCDHALFVPRDPFSRRRQCSPMRFLSLGPVVAAPFPEVLRQLRQLHGQHPFDVVIAASTAMACYALALPGAVAILEEHNSLTRWMHERFQAQRTPIQSLRCWLSWRKSAVYESCLFRRFRLITVVSEQDAASVRRLVPEGAPPVAITPNGVDCSCCRPDDNPANSPGLVFNGSLTYSANYDAVGYFLNDIYPLIRQQRQDVSLTITGSTQGVGLQSLRLDTSVQLSGYVEDVRPLVAGARVCVAPIRQGGGTRIKILEAMALGTPVVATSKGAEGLEVIEGEHILLADDPAGFANSTLRLLRDAELRQRLATNARRLVEQRYDWAQIGKQFVALVEATVERGRAGRHGH